MLSLISGDPMDLLSNIICPSVNPFEISPSVSAAKIYAVESAFGSGTPEIMLLPSSAQISSVSHAAGIPAPHAVHPAQPWETLRDDSILKIISSFPGARGANPF